MDALSISECFLCWTLEWVFLTCFWLSWVVEKLLTGSTTACPSSYLTATDWMIPFLFNYHWLNDSVTITCVSTSTSTEFCNLVFKQNPSHRSLCAACLRGTKCIYVYENISAIYAIELARKDDAVHANEITSMRRKECTNLCDST